MKKVNRFLGLVALLGAGCLAIAVGCAQTPLDESWGSSYSANNAAMVANPEAGTAEAGPIEGLDAVTAEIVIENYKENQSTKECDSEQEFLIYSQ
jgi:hypothetical protein